ncbi:hypothetical protein ACEZNI_004633, partial [Vibrio parahaemolyticus]
LSIRREDNHMVVLINGGSNGDSITLENAYSDGRYRIEEIVLTDGTTFTPQSLPLYASDGDDVIQGSGFNEQITAGAGNDIVYADGGEDVVDGGVGADELHGGDGNDQLFGGEGNDTLIVNGRGSNTLDGGTGDDTLKINRSTDYYYNRDVARYATNTLTGGVGNDRLEGSVGAETYIFNVGDGADVINDYDYNTFNKTDRIQFGEGITKDTLSIRREGNHLVIMIGGIDSGDSITIENAYTDKRYRIEELVHADGTVIVSGHELFELPMLGSDVSDTLSGSGFNEELRGLAGDDTLHGLDGNDQLFGGEGNDTLT